MISSPPVSLGKKKKRLLYLPKDQNSVIQLSLRNSPRFSKLTPVRKVEEGGKLAYP